MTGVLDDVRTSKHLQGEWTLSGNESKNTAGHPRRLAARGSVTGHQAR